MQQSPQLSVPPSSATTSISGSAKRRSTRILPRSEEALSLLDIGGVMGDKASTKNVDETNSSSHSPTLREGWKHPAELQYLRRADWSQDLMITYLCQKAFTVPPRQTNTTLSYTEITRSYSGEKISIPRGYRIPLMFVAKFQWESLRLVLNSASEWEEYKFDIIHLSRLCTHFFKQAKTAASENKLTKAWRSPMFDRALIRFYRKWMVSREWSVKKFWEEFDEDEYTLDVLKFDWSRWVLKGHKGFVLTKEEVLIGITADQYTKGLKRRPDGTWVWGGDDSGAKDAISLDSLSCLASQDAVEAITDATPSHDSLEVKQELLEANSEGLVLNKNGKRPRGQDGDSPRKLQVRRSNKNKNASAKKKTTATSSPLPRGVSPPAPESAEKLEGTQPEDDTVMDKDLVPQPFLLTNTLKIIPPSHSPKRRKIKNRSTGKGGKSAKSSSSKTAMLCLPPTSTPADDPPLIQTPESSSPKDLSPMVFSPLEDLSITIPPVSTGDEGMVHESPLSGPSDSRISDVPIPWLANPSDIVASVQSDTGSSLLAHGNAGVSNDSQESNPTSAMAFSGPSMQTDSTPDPGIVPDPEVSDHWPKATSPASSDSGSGPEPEDTAHVDWIDFVQTLQGKKSASPGPPILNVAGVVGCGSVEVGEERSMVEVIPLTPVLAQSEQPTNLTPGVDEVETIVVGREAVVEEVGVEVEENGTGTVVEDGGDLTTIALADSAVEEEGGKDMVGEPDVLDAIVDDTNEVDVRMEKRAVEVQPVQSLQETLTVDDKHRVDVARDMVPVDIQSCQETPTINVSNGMGSIALEMGQVEGQILNSPSSMGTPTVPGNDSKAIHHPALESVPSHAELQAGHSQGVELADNKMNVDEEIIQPIQPSPPLPIDGTLAPNTLFMTPLMRTKSLHSIQLLQSLIQFLRLPARDRQPKVSRTLENDLEIVKSQGTCPAVEQAHFPLTLGPYSLTEEIISVDQRLDVLAYVSLTLAKNLYPYRGKELESKIDLLDQSLQRQFEMLQKVDSRPCGGGGGEIDESYKELGVHPGEEFDRNTASTSTQTISQGVQTLSPSHINRQFESIQVQTDAENEDPVSHQTLSADATMVDLTVPMPLLQEPSSTLAEKGDPALDNNPFVAKTVMSMMRNMADLLDFTTQGLSLGSVRSLKGKEKEVIDVDMMPSYLASPALTTILEEFKGMKEEMRRSQQRSQNEAESMRLSHFMEVEALKDEIRNIEGRGKQELEDVTRRYNQQIGELKATIRLREERERDREKESASETKLPSTELLEIRRRVASLEARSRSDSISVDMLRSASRSSMTNGHFSEPVVTRHPNYLPHLIPTDFEEHSYGSTFRAPRQFTREGSMSKPGTPAPSDRNPFSTRHPDVMDLDESMPLPAKSQRKLHMMNFPRPPMG